MITTLVTLVMFFLSANAKAESKSSAPQPAPHSINQASETKFRWGEVVPNYAVQLTFTFPNCANESTTPRVEEYESSSTLLSVDTGKPTSVRTVHIYLLEQPHLQNCQLNSKREFVRINHKIAADDTRMTHYFITMGNRISLERPENKASLK